MLSPWKWTPDVIALCYTSWVPRPSLPHAPSSLTWAQDPCDEVMDVLLVCEGQKWTNQLWMGPMVSSCKMWTWPGESMAPSAAGPSGAPPGSSARAALTRDVTELLHGPPPHAPLGQCCCKGFTRHMPSLLLSLFSVFIPFRLGIFRTAPHRAKCHIWHRKSACSLLLLVRVLLLSRLVVTENHGFFSETKTLRGTH